MRFNLPGICGYGLSFQMDGFRAVFAAVTIFAWAMALLLSPQYMRREERTGRYYFFTIVTLIGTLGVFLSADFFTALIFFELMSLASYTWVAQTEKKDALRAADTYMAIGVIGGLAILMGLFLLYHMYGTLDFERLQALVEASGRGPMLYAAGICILAGFGAKAGIFPLHIWLPKAHPVAPAPASALLSGVLTKTGIFGVIILTVRVFAGDRGWGALLAALGACTMLVGALLAVFSTDLKHTLACSSVSQIGFIVTGLGMYAFSKTGGALAARGAVLHMVNHSLIKLVLFLSAGVIFLNTHELDLDKIRGFGRRKPFLAVCFAIGALAIGGVPGFSGYISKTLLHESILECGGGDWFRLLEALFIFSGGLTVAYMLKLFITIFVEKNLDEGVQNEYDANRHYAEPATMAAIGIPAAALLLWGFFPHALMDNAARLALDFFALDDFGEAVRYFSVESLSGALVSVGIGLLVYFVFTRIFLMDSRDGGRVFHNRWPGWLDLENSVYRPILLRFLPFICTAVCRVADTAVDLAVVALRRTVYRDTPLPRYEREGNIATRLIGGAMNKWRNLANRTWRRGRPDRNDYAHLLALKCDEIDQNNQIIAGSVSFGLLLFCIGFCLMLFYLIGGDIL